MPGEGLRKLLCRYRITHATLPQAALSVLGDAAVSDYTGVVRSAGAYGDGWGMSLQALVVAGEACPPRLAQQWCDRTRFINAYGPTEATVCATMYHVPSDWTAQQGQGVPIGEPMANARVYILDEQKQPVPLGVAGELYVGGAGVARGYLNRAELTAERFIPDPFSDEPDARMYRTGDLCRWRADGVLEYLGRNDFQVKDSGASG